MTTLNKSFLLIGAVLCISTSILIGQKKDKKINSGIDLEKLRQEVKFRCVGPTRGGRVTTVTGVINKPNIFYMGATGGGVWKSNNYGNSWVNVSDGYFKSPSIGDIAVAKSNDAIVYVGTGSDGIRSNIISGKGIYKSENSGKSWEFIGLKRAGQIGAVIIHPTNPDIVYAAALGQVFGPNPERGVYKTSNGGKDWELVHFISENTGAIDLEFHPTNPDIVYASMWEARRKPWSIISGGKEGGVFKSVDAGKNWKKIIKGMPTDLIGKSDLAVSPADPDRVYVLLEAEGAQGGLYRSDDAGESFNFISTERGLTTRPFYFCNVDANPVNAEEIYVSSVRFLVSTNGGKSWERKSTPHADNHAIWINPDQPNIWIQGNDGGANVSINGGETWSSQQNQATAELYQVEVDDQFPYWLYAGQQDNSTISVPSSPPYVSPSGSKGFWRAVGGCETGPAVPKPGSPHIVYSNCKGRFSVYNKLTGQEQNYYVGAENWYGANPKDLKYRFQRVSPIHVSPHNPDVIYHCSQFVHKSTNEGKSWEIISPDLTAFRADRQVISGSPITRDITGEEYYSTIYEINESTIEPGLIWVGSNDGLIHVTKDGGENWKNVTPKGLPEGGRIDCIDPSKLQKGKAYAAIHRYMLDDWKPYLYKTEDYGASWTLITNGIPDNFPTRTIRADNSVAGLLYAGTESGLFVSMDDGASWNTFQLNLPIVPITDIKIFRKDLILSTMGRSFWILDDISFLQQMSFGLTGNVQLLQPKAAYRTSYRGTASDAIPYYPSPNAKVYYYLPESAKEFTFEIVNEAKQTVYFYDNKNQRDRSSLKTSKGLHVLQWDMRNYGKASTSSWSHRGPRVTPGNYSIRIKTANEKSEALLKVLLDPRMEATGLTSKDLKVQEELHLKVLKLKEEVSDLAKKIRDIKNGSSDDNKKAKMQGMLDQIETKRGTYQRPMLMSQLNYLQSSISGSDQHPGQEALNRYEELKERYLRIKSNVLP